MFFCRLKLPAIHICWLVKIHVIPSLILVRPLLNQLIPLLFLVGHANLFFKFLKKNYCNIIFQYRLHGPQVHLLNIAQSLVRLSCTLNTERHLFFTILDLFSKVTFNSWEFNRISVMTAWSSDISWHRMLNVSWIFSWKNMMGNYQDDILYHLVPLWLGCSTFLCFCSFSG